MIVTDLHLAGISSSPTKAEPPLVVDPDGMLPGEITLQRLEAVAWRYPKVREVSRGIQLDQLAERDPCDR